MILHQQLLCARRTCADHRPGHSQRRQTPRRFNLRFALFDDERYAEVSTMLDNLFDTEQLVICWHFARRSKQRLEHLWKPQPGLLVGLYEAHHLVWSEDAPSREYQAIEQLAEHVPGVLLLTATPEQLGDGKPLRSSASAGP